MGYVIKTENLTKKFGRKIAVHNVNMTVEKGDIYGFIGKNGAGKTTFMRMIVDLAYPTMGKISLFDGIPLSEARKKIGSLIESPSLFKGVSAYENLKRYAILTNSTEEEVQEILQFVGLSDTGKKKVKAFSLGMKQRLGIGIALLGKPELLVLDEPVNGLDPQGIKEVRDLIIKLNKEKGVTFLISSHLLDELSKITTKYGIINDGVLVEEITVEDLEKKCRHEVRFKTGDNERAVAVLTAYEDKLETHLDGDYVYVLNETEKAAEYNAVLIKNDITVYEMSVLTKGVEDYFVQKIKSKV